MTSLQSELEAPQDPIDYPRPGREDTSERAALARHPLVREAPPILRADALAYVVFERPELSVQRDFLVDFGMRVAHESADAVFLRGCGTEPYLYVAQRGARPRFVGLGFSVRDPADLETLADKTGAPLEAADDFAGGVRVRLRDPGGFRVDVVHRDPVEPLPTRESPHRPNTPWEKVRRNRGLRPPLEPCPVVRAGHCVLMAENFAESAAWYMHHLGLLPSDVLCTRDGTPAGAFLRLDRGSEPADHHSLFLAQGFKPACLHTAFETVDLDAIGQGDQYLQSRGHRHEWGIGRHILGSQLFCYYRDPYGDEIEHYADGDVFDNTVPTQYRSLEAGNVYQWGPDLPPEVLPRPKPRDLWTLATAIVTKRVDFGLLRKIQKAASGKARPWM